MPRIAEPARVTVPAVSVPITGRGARQLTVVALLVVGSVAGMLVAVALGVAGAATVPGLPDAGPLVTVALPMVRVLSEVAATVTVGMLLLAAVLAPPQRSGHLDVAGFRSVRTAAVSAAVWAAAALLMVPLTVAEASGRPLVEALGSAALPVPPTSSAWLLTGVIAAAVAVTSAGTLTWGCSVGLFVAAVGGLLPVAASGHSAVGASHDIATDSLLLHIVAAALWVGGLLATLLVATTAPRALRTALPRFSTLAGWCWAVLAVSGLVNLAVRVGVDPRALLTPYGAIVVGKTVALAGLGLLGLVHRRRTVPAAARGRTVDLLRWGGLELLIMVVTIGLAVGLGRTPPPPGPTSGTGRTEEALGYELAPPDGPLQLVAAVRFDVVFALVVAVLLITYLAGLGTLRAAGAAWPLRRTVAWCAGVVVVLVATSSGIGRYGAAMPSVAAVGQVLLLAVAPALLAAGAPLRLARRALPAVGATGGPSPKGGLLWLLRRPLVRRLRRPGAAPLVLAAVQLTLYGAGWLDLLLASSVGRQGLDALLFLTGCVVAAGLTGSSRPRLWEVLALLGVQLATGIALLVRPDVVGEEHFRGVGLAWVPDLLAEQRWAALVWLCLPVAAGLLLATVSPGRGDSRPIGSAKLPATLAAGVRPRGVR
ncbi:cytochrome c oxidase assembly protein [Pseudonocardia sp. KRD-184]|uniref:Cytochrome c oxidase assembly protein n=1 Tax=Pseudonocardia oceani TaxID=2792013 RepID=A0ABS6U3D5_9PSEU|nr:cytochrome c oxidase assembly protein [Pseudonocardia oceani]MBW0088835.1 cytochrome c oxidase assembly protein [Pseudonocardia oceani]MBW0097947.1 cytochrome c oxidase assembly protein [Pseudonocardia oceani]MBW0120937.1 cytochrome c oxidase assembly protein [Pseudonocardia oceani]MBW0126521.1 cytochrome c oxidase assembly protein [Pseudonocardia oceani]